jgi:hypothetical protein
MKEKHIDLLRQNPEHRKNWPSNQSFIRRGKSGSYKDEMPNEVLDAFIRKAKDVLTDHGYL